MILIKKGAVWKRENWVLGILKKPSQWNIKTPFGHCYFMLIENITKQI